MTAPRYFVILGAMRTGSNLLEQIIGGLPGTICHGEAFNPGFIGGPRRDDLLGWTLEQRDADPLGMLQAMLDQAGDEMPGFRLFNNHSEVVLNHVLADPACARIVLRRDPVQSFVSLKIAQETGQWVLRNPRRRRVARVRFDPVAFDRYRKRLAAHYRRISRGMAAAGTTAMEIGYDDLTDPGLPGRLARFLGRPDGQGLPPSLIRQNPGALRTKVSNYAEMCAHLGIAPEPLAPEPLPGPSAFQVSDSVPLAAAPVPGPGLVPLLALLHRIDCRDSGAEALGRQPMITRALRGSLLASGSAEGRQAFAVVSPPPRRLKWLMGRALFAASRGPARMILQEQFPDLPDSVENWKKLSADARNAVFAGFLDLVADALADRADLPCPAAWRPQAEWLETMQGAGPEIRVCAEGDFDGLVAAVVQAAGIARFPRGQVMAMAAITQPLPDDDPIAAGLADRANALHARDVDELGYLWSRGA